MESKLKTPEDIITFARYIARGIQTTSVYSSNDIEQMAMIEILKRLKSLKQNVEISTFLLIRQIRQRIILKIQKENKHRMVSLDLFDGETISEIKRVSSYLSPNIDIEVMLNILKTLSYSDKELIYLYFYKSYTYKNVAIKVGITTTKATKRIKDILLMLNLTLKEIDNEKT